MLDVKNPSNSETDIIEAQIERDHAQIAASVAALQDRFSADALLLRGVFAARGQLTHAARSVANSVGGSVRDNPLAAGLVVAGLAWLVFGRKSSAEAEPPLAGTKFESLTRWEDEGGPPSAETEPDPHPDDDWLDAARTLRAKAAEAVKKLEAAPKSALSPAADTLRERAAVMQAYSADLAKALRKGLGHLSSAAQDRIVAARDAALLATESTQNLASGTVRNSPMLSGLITAIFGAVVAAFIPISAREKQLLGPSADALIDEARRIYEAEAERATELAADLVSGLQDDLITATSRLTDTAEALVHPAA